MEKNSQNKNFPEKTLLNWLRKNCDFCVSIRRDNLFKKDFFNIYVDINGVRISIEYVVMYGNRSGLFWLCHRRRLPNKRDGLSAGS